MPVAKDPQGMEEAYSQPSLTILYSNEALKVTDSSDSNICSQLQ